MPSSVVRKPPTNAELSAALGAAKPLWDLVVVDMARELELADHEWKSYGAKHGWAFRLKRGKRNIVHMAPHQGCFTVLFILGRQSRERRSREPAGPRGHEADRRGAALSGRHGNPLRGEACDGRRPREEAGQDQARELKVAGARCSWSSLTPSAGPGRRPGGPGEAGLQEASRRRGAPTWQHAEAEPSAEPARLGPGGATRGPPG